MRASTYGKTSYPDMTERQNPQFKQTATKYISQKKQRKQLDHRKHLVSNQVKHYQKINEQLSKSLEQKQHELKWLKKVRQRYLSSLNEVILLNKKQKKQKQEEQRLKLQQLRNYNMGMRQRSIQNINDALNQLHKKKKRAYDDVNRTMKQLKDNYRQKKSISDAVNNMKKSRVKGKNRVNKFFQKKNTELTNYYKLKAEQQEQKFISGVKEIGKLHERESTYKRKISKKQAKMSQILSEIEELKRSSLQIATSQIRSDRYADLSSTKNKSRVSRTNRTENISIEDKNSYGFRLTNVGSTQFIDQEEEIK